MKQSTQLLEKSGLRQTAARESILQLLVDARRPLSHQDILKHCKVAGSLDRVTVYRTMETLLEAGLIHRIQGTDGAWRFCKHEKESSGKCAGNHIHFLCAKYNQMSCMPEQPLPWVSAPPGATVHSKQLVVHGYCAACVVIRKKGKTRQPVDAHNPGNGGL